jgi:hypothetical protein
MPASPQSALVYSLARLGLSKTLLATKGRDRYFIHRLEQSNERLTLIKLGELKATGAPVIGRVGRPEAILALPWRKTLTFYGRWYDELAAADRNYALRIKIAQAPRATLLTQIQRDERFGLVGTYYSVFQTIMDCKRRIPLILLDTALVDDDSLPVILPDSVADKGYREMESLLRLMLKSEEQKALSMAEDDVVVQEF